MAEKTIRSFDGTKIFYRIVRKKRKKHALIFLHGVGGNWTIWKDELRFFEKLGYTTIALDLRGHGMSDIDLPDYKFTAQRHIRDIKKIIDEEKIREYIFIGHSLGGGLSIIYCERFKVKRPQAMILIETAYRNPFDKDHELGLNPYLIKIIKFIVNHEPTKIKHMPHFKEVDYDDVNKKDKWFILLKLLYATPLRSIMKTLEGMEKYTGAHMKSMEQTLKRIKMPVLVIGGLKDNTVPPEFSEEIHWLIHNSKLKLFRKAHHRIPIEDASDLNKIVHQFLNQHHLN